MAGFFYFIPGAKASDNPSQLNQWGLSYLVDGDDRLYQRQCGGPGGEAGLILGSQHNFESEDVKMSASLQWRKFPKPFADRQAYIGWDPAKQMPVASDLARPKQLSGIPLTLADGAKWQIPTAKAVGTDGTSYCSLPMSYGVDEETGDWIANQVMPKYRAIWNHANSYLESMMQAVAAEAKKENPGEPQWEIPDYQSMIVDALQVNYRVSAMELATLGVLTTEIAQPIANILIDAQGYKTLKKKEAQDTGRG